MRKCIRCGMEMMEGCELRQADNLCGVDVAESERVFAKRIGRLKAAVCPECGEISLYIGEPEIVRERMSSGRRGCREE